MKRVLRRVLGATLFSAALLAAASCNAVLSIEDAKLDPQLSVGDASSFAAPAACAATGDACMDCVVKSCCQQYVDCLGDKDCELAMADYNYLTLHGKDTDAREALAAGNQKAQELGTCINGTAFCVGCKTGTLTTSCKNYCDCMTLNCSAFLPDAGESCETSCLRLTPTQANCRRAHCGVGAPLDPATHCPHAVGHAPCT